MDFTFQQYEESAQAIRARLGGFAPKVAMILGSGLGYLGDQVEGAVTVPYGEIPYFKSSTAPGHKGRLVFGTLEGQRVAVMQGRMHHYEGYSYEEVSYAVRVLRLLGCDTLIVTNACGGINREFAPGDLMLLSDHINMLGANSLIGPNDERFGPRFPDMTEAYPHRLREKAHQAAGALGFACKEGVYAIFPGPCYETAAEIRAYEHLGADAIGMSTVPEVIAANYLGMAVLGIACITNMATGIAREKHSHQEVLRIANESSQKLCALVERVVREL